MSTVKPFKSKTSVQQEAAQWVIELDQGDLSEARQQALQRWLAKSRTNEREFMELAQLWGLADQLAQYLSVESRSSPAAPRPLRWHSQRAIAACFMAVCILSGVVFLFAPGIKQAPSTLHYHTAIGEIREIALADGSTISLNTNSRIEVVYSDHQRRVLLQSGEALFKVAKDTARPFSVEVGDKVVTAVGTAFNIRKSGHSANLTVTEGRVRVDGRATQTIDDRSDKADLPSLMVVAGEEITIAPKAQKAVAKFDQTDVERKLSWTTGMLTFDETPLEQVIAEVTRYTETKIIIDDQALKTLKVGGYFKAGETEAMFEVLQLSFNIDVKLRDDNVVVLKKNDDQRAIQ